MNMSQAHIFIDNSNLLGGAQRTAQANEGAPWQSVRIYWRNFFQLIESDLLPVQRMLAGSLPPGNEPLWESARRYGYDTSLLKRVPNDNGKLAEQAVDEVMHAKIAGALLDFEPPPEQTLVLVTGDGNLSDYGTSFVQQVERAAKRQWNVLIYSWKSQLSGKYAAARLKHPAYVNIVELDDYYKEITFIKGGTYTSPAGTVTASERIVSQLGQRKR